MSVTAVTDFVITNVSPVLQVRNHDRPCRLTRLTHSKTTPFRLWHRISLTYKVRSVIYTMSNQKQAGHRARHDGIWERLMRQRWLLDICISDECGSDSGNDAGTWDCHFWINSISFTCRALLSRCSTSVRCTSFQHNLFADIVFGRR